MSFRPKEVAARAVLVEDLGERLELVAGELCRVLHQATPKWARHTVLRWLAGHRPSGFGDLAVMIERAFPEEHVEVWAALMLETDEGGEGG